MRNLAQRSSGAAREIKALIDASVAKVALGGKLVAQAGAAMNDIVDSVGRVTEVIAEISAASAGQAAGIDNVHAAITEIDQVTQKNAELVEEASAATDAMRGQAAKLAELVSVFQLAATTPGSLGASRSKATGVHALSAAQLTYAPQIAA